VNIEQAVKTRLAEADAGVNPWFHAEAKAKDKAGRELQIVRWLRGHLVTVEGVHTEDADFSLNEIGRTYFARYKRGGAAVSTPIDVTEVDGKMVLTLGGNHAAYPSDGREPADFALFVDAVVYATGAYKPQQSAPDRLAAIRRWLGVPRG
jgi:hypothetical protein